MRSLHILAVIGAAVAVSSCQSGRASGADAHGRPSVLRMAFTASTEDPDTAAHRHEFTRRYLEKALGVRVEGYSTTNYGGVIEAFRAHKIDAASISPFSYVLATQKVPLEAIACRTDGNGDSVYAGSLAVRWDSPIHSIDDLVRHSKELTISFVDPASASGFLVENAFLQSKGIEPQRDFRKVMFSMSHPASILTLKAGKVDVAAVMERLVNGYLKNGQLKPGDIRVIWTSPHIPNQPIAVSKDLPPAFIEEIRQAFLQMKDKDPEAFKAQIPKAYSMLSGPGSAYVRADDAMFDPLRQMARNVPNLNLLDH